MSKNANFEAAAQHIRLHEHRPGLWLAQAALQAAAQQAAVLCPQALHGLDGLAWVESRRRSFQAGRSVAAVALSALNRNTEVARAGNGAPCWPAGCVGSIAHDAQHAVAVVGESRRWAALGVDVEPDEPLPPDAAGLVMQAGDQNNLMQAFGGEASAHDRLVFCAKECVHKALNPWRGAWLEFDEVGTQWWIATPRSGHWRAVPLSTAAENAFGGAVLEGEWWRADGSLWTLLAVSC